MRRTEETVRAQATGAPESWPGTPRAVFPSPRRLRDSRELRRVTLFLIAGGISAVITLAVTALLGQLAHQRFFLAAACGTELGILVNFSINDRVAFGDLPGRQRPLRVRLIRFHATCAVGQTLIYLLSLFFYTIAGWGQVFAQGLPIIAVTGVNFTLHRVWTYRRPSHARRG